MAAVKESHNCCCGLIHVKFPAILIALLTIGGALFNIYDDTVNFPNINDVAFDIFVQCTIVIVGVLAIAAVKTSYATLLGPLVIHYVFNILADCLGAIKFVMNYYDSRMKDKDYHADFVNLESALNIACFFSALWFIVILKQCYAYLVRKACARASRRKVNEVTYIVSGKCTSIPDL
ncbi:hypothetical protein QR680_004122 [Steinernema hermaphroditum]|uniref:Uncharacterized protein n=1 Tax=Steinernema hermaphroditum TaxID=289476 RepID=A0AA39LT79_9BILA|nr:hypothetical protein QR680_004122 [Steinernema hermaphroditum]